MGAIIDHLYTGCGHNHESWLSAKFGNWWRLNNIKEPKKVISEVNGLEKTEISKLLFNHASDTLNQGVLEVFPKGYGSENYELATKLRRNVYDFAVYKSAYFSEKLKGASKEEAIAIIEEYERQLKVEAAYATRSSRSALQWTEFQQRKDVYANLEYLPSRSVEKRVTHEKLYGIIKPIDDEFWNNNFPPNGWGCKCRAAQTSAPVTGGETPKITNPKGIAGNSGKQEVIFTPSHPFVEAVSKEGKKNLKLQFEELKRQIPYNNADVKLKNKSSINVHLYADDQDLKKNFEAAELLAKQVPGTEIKITPHVVLDGVKNPEYLINNKVADLKQQSGRNVSSNISSALKQNCEVLVIRLDKSYPFSVDRYINNLKGNLALRSKVELKKVFIIDGDGKVVEFTP